jgi:hypothetical protein
MASATIRYFGLAFIAIVLALGGCGTSGFSNTGSTWTGVSQTTGIGSNRG